MIILEKVIYPAHISKRTPPKNINEEDVSLFQHEFTSSICETSVYVFKRVFILKDSVYDLSSFRFFESFTHINGFFNSNDKFERLKLMFHKNNQIPKGIWITQNWTWMYFHWITDALPRLIAVEDLHEGFPVLLPESYRSIPFVEESLNLLGYDFLYFSDKKRNFIKQLVLPSHTASPGNYNSLLINKLRSKFIQKYTSPFRKIFVSRSKAKQRFLSNEDEVIELLIANGFEIHIFEEYTLKKQIALMNESRCLIGLHGAGLTNMIFMPSNGSVIELRNKLDNQNNCYFSLSSELSHDYYYIECQGDSLITEAVNLNVDLNLLKSLLELVSLR